jgi:hypothetical protein
MVLLPFWDSGYIDLFGLAKVKTKTKDALPGSLV